MLGKKTGGRKKGGMNKTTAELKQAVNMLVSNELSNMIVTLDKIRKVNPAKYLDLMVRLVELVTPKPMAETNEAPKETDWYAEQAKKMLTKVS